MATGRLVTGIEWQPEGLCTVPYSVYVCPARERAHIPDRSIHDGSRLLLITFLDQLSQGPAKY